MLRGVKANHCGWVLPPKGNKFCIEYVGGFIVALKKIVKNCRESTLEFALQKLMGSNNIVPRSFIGSFCNFSGTQENQAISLSL